MPLKSKLPKLKAKAAAIIDPSCPHHLDHLLPICSLLNIPLLTTDASIKHIASLYPPSADIVLFFNDHELFEFLKADYTTLVTSTKYGGKEIKNLMYNLYNHRIQTIFLPHGFSKKGFISHSMSPFFHQENAFMYSPMMENDLKKIAALSNVKMRFFVGDFRKRFYIKRQEAFDQRLQKLIPPQWDRRLPTILYAPTWSDEEDSSSIMDFYRLLVEGLHQKMNLIIRLHPFIERDHPSIAYYLQSLSEERENLWVHWNIPFVFPFFSIVDALIADNSSILYDFLSTGKPIYRLNPSSSPMEVFSKPLEGKTLLSLLQGGGISAKLDSRKIELYRRIFPEIDEKEIKESFARFVNQEVTYA